ncbi:hypothetical protein Q5741_02660 [Paenibacillus sp. JX-17]|uniref:Uncharacterized protein n=1 Tax=Paenibacillus lacisoli TaxID=3064525 RepID=A0ABT9C7R9_9BACL|nr:hypothetical protein [Paenibacillus sp. JX-17]MDO7905314.1 hypothetical protein [Paenibacillus sp. JX-17]
MRHWVGRQVVIFSGPDRQTRLQGVLEKWDDTKQCVVLGPKMSVIPFSEIATIQPLPSLRERRTVPRSKLYPVSYIMKVPMQFDNAVYFKSWVTVWRGNRLIAYGTRLKRHDREHAVLEDGRILRKDSHTFVVRSLQGG